MDIYIRIKAYLSSLADQPCYSNSIKVKVYPCYVSETPPQVWYMVGTAVGSWDNKAGGEGETIIPMALKKMLNMMLPQAKVSLLIPVISVVIS